MPQVSRRSPAVLFTVLFTALAALLCSAIGSVAAGQSAVGDPLAPTPMGARAAALAIGFGFTAAEQEAVAEGAIVSREWPTTQPAELAAAVAMRLPMPLAEAERSVLRSGLGIAADPAQIDVQVINGPVTGRATSEGGEAAAYEAALGRFGFAPDETEEAKAFLRANSGNRFNLSTAELAVLARSLRRDGANAGEPVSRATKAYRAVLAERLRLYRTQGLDGIDDYDRGDGTVSVALSLRSALDGFRAQLPGDFAPLLTALDAYPLPLPAGVRERFYWKKARIEDRPTVMLLHVLTLRQEGAVLFAVREFYVGHSYEALQQFGVLAADGEKSVLLLANITATERVTGLFAGLARAIGTGRVQEALEAYFASLRQRAPEELARSPF